MSTSNSDSDDEVVWGPVTLKEIKKMFKKPHSRKPDRRRTIDPILKNLKSADIQNSDSKDLEDVPECVQEEKSDISSSTYFTPNESGVIEVNKKENSNYETAFEETKTAIADCLSETLADFVTSAKTRPTQIDLRNFHQTLVNEDDVEFYSEDCSYIAEQSHISLDFQESNEQDVIVISSGEDESDNDYANCRFVESVWDKGDIEVKRENLCYARSDVTNISGTSRSDDNGTCKTFETCDTETYKECDQSIARETNIQQSNPYSCSNYNSCNDQSIGGDSIRTDNLEDDVFVSPGEIGNYSYISDASETDDIANKHIEGQMQAYYPIPQDAHSYLQVPQIFVTQATHHPVLPEKFETDDSDKDVLEEEEDYVVPNNTACYSSRSEIASSSSTSIGDPIPPVCKPTEVPEFRLASIDESSSEKSSGHLNTTLDEIEKLLMDSSFSSSNSERNANPKFTSVNYFSPKDLRLEPSFLKDLTPEKTHVLTPLKDAAGPSTKSSSESKIQLLSSGKKTDNLFRPKDYSFENSFNSITVEDSPLVSTKKTPKITPLKSKTLIPKPKDFKHPKSASKPLSANKDTPIPGSFRIPRNPSSNKSARSNLFAKKVVSPVAMYIKYSPQAVLTQNIAPTALKKVEAVPHQKQQTPRKETVKPIPEVIYKPSKQQIKSSEEQLNLPPSIAKMVKESVLIKHEKRYLKERNVSEIHKKLVNDSELSQSFINDSTVSDTNPDISIWAAKQPYGI